MTTATLTYSSARNKINPFLFFGALIIGALSIFYVFEMNSLINGSYTIKNYQRQLDSVLGEGKNLEVNFAKTGFMGTIKEKTQQLSFEKVKEVKYIQILDTSLAKAK
ncbi:MAG: hypothetical protein AAB352_01900 [Patescibacteria group bacterium]